tara:strand:+ start:421 stop:801 length:381 start_codon:yes stop_codon:yes gene_type:complete
MLKLVIILSLLNPFAVFALEPTAGIVCNELNKKEKTEFLFKNDDEKIFSKVFKRINGEFKEVGNVVGRKMSSFILFEDNTIDKNIDFSWHLDEVTKNLRPFILSKKNKKNFKLPAKQSCISKNFWY